MYDCIITQLIRSVNCVLRSIYNQCTMLIMDENKTRIAISINLPLSLRESINAIADAEEMTTAQWVRQTLRRAVKARQSRQATMEKGPSGEGS